MLHRCEKDLEFIHYHYHAYIPLHYVLLFPHGTFSWIYNLPLEQITHFLMHNHIAKNTPKKKYIIQIKFQSYYLHTQAMEYSLIQSGG
jgi:hypothetical protein